MSDPSSRYTGATSTIERGIEQKISSGVTPPQIPPTAEPAVPRRLTATDSGTTIEQKISNGVTPPQMLARESTDRFGDQEGWQRIIDKHLIEWGRNPSRFDPDEIVPPSPFIVAGACRVAMRLRDAGWAAPLRVVPDGDGGIAFEHRAGECFESLELKADGQVELIRFLKSKVMQRQQLPNVSEWA